jgi:hypothetical protein
MTLTLHTRLHTVPFWYLPGMPIPVVPARDGRADMAIIQKLISAHGAEDELHLRACPGRVSQYGHYSQAYGAVHGDNLASALFDRAGPGR